MKITNNERIALNMIALNTYQPANGSRPESFKETSSIWSSLITDTSAPETLKGKTLSATCASLAKKSLVTTYDDTRLTRGRRFSGALADESTICLTRAGYDAWSAEFPATELNVMHFLVTVTANEGVSADDVVEAMGSMFGSSADAVASVRQITAKQASRIR